jgi:quercetin dioxygenase-like cupin family protein
MAERTAGVSFHALTVLQGTGRLRVAAQGAPPIELAPGESVLIPACIEEYEIHADASDESLELIKAYMPHVS